MNRISVVLIVKNEEELLPRCLDSVRSADEIVIVDTGSTDRTLEVCRTWAEHMHCADRMVYGFFQWCDDFSKARNYAKSLATGDWILSIDADEFLTCPFAVVREATVQGFMAVSVQMTSESSPGTKHYFPKLFRNSQQIWWVGAVHNLLSVNGEEVASVPTITYGYSPAHREDPTRSLRILEKEVATRPDALREMFYLGREYYYRKNLDQCVILLGRYVQQSQAWAEKAEAFYIMARAFWEKHQADDARDACVQAIILNPYFKEACYFMAILAGHGHENPRWQANADQWLRMAAAADNRHVLFVREVPDVPEPSHLLRILA